MGRAVVPPNHGAAALPMGLCKVPWLPPHQLKCEVYIVLFLCNAKSLLEQVESSHFISHSQWRGPVLGKGQDYGIDATSSIALAVALAELLHLVDDLEVIGDADNGHVKESGGCSIGHGQHGRLDGRRHHCDV